MKKDKVLRWYRIEGISKPTLSDFENPFRFVYYVESESKKHVLKRFGGDRTVEGPDSSRVKVSFPRSEAKVDLLPHDWQPDKDRLESGRGELSNMLTRSVPATRYPCDCGRIHVSEFPYPSMWCTCGRKALPAGAREVAQVLISEDIVYPRHISDIGDADRL